MPGRFLLDTHVIVQMGTKGGLEAMPVTVQRILDDRQWICCLAWPPRLR